MMLNLFFKMIVALLLIAQGSSAASNLVLEKCALSFLNNGKESISIGNIAENYDHISKVEVSLEDTLQLSFISYESLEQARVLVGNPEEALESAYEPLQKYVDESSSYLYKFKIPLTRISKYLKDREQLVVTLLAANSNSTIFKTLFVLEVENPVVYDSPLVSRLEPKTEIFHVFQAPPKMIAAPIAQLFCLIIVVILAMLLFTWMVAGLVSIKLSSVYSYLFIGCLIALEYTFLQYYMGANIFTTLMHLAWIGFPTLFIGSRALRFSKAL